MPSLMFGMFFILAAATLTFGFAAHLAGHGNVVAADICLTGSVFCQHPEYLALAAGGAGILWFSMRISD
jgi:hypothetical protein